jgi:hypothetical protein
MTKKELSHDEGIMPFVARFERDQISSHLKKEGRVTKQLKRL